MRLHACVCVGEVLRTGNPQCLFDSNLDRSSLRNIYKSLETCNSAYQIEQKLEFRLRWKSPGIGLKSTHTHTHFIFIVWNLPRSQPLDNNRAVMSLYCIQITCSSEWKEGEIICLSLKFGFPPLAISSGCTASTKTQVCTSTRVHVHACTRLQYARSDACTLAHANTLC